MAVVLEGREKNEGYYFMTPKLSQRLFGVTQNADYFGFLFLFPETANSRPKFNPHRLKLVALNR